MLRLFRTMGRRGGMLAGGRGRGDGDEELVLVFGLDGRLADEDASATDRDVNDSVPENDEGDANRDDDGVVNADGSVWREAELLGKPGEQEAVVFLQTGRGRGLTFGGFCCTVRRIGLRG